MNSWPTGLKFKPAIRQKRVENAVFHTFLFKK